MRNYVIINGVNSLTIQGLAINNLPPITKPMIRTQREEIDGRDGDIVTELGYSAYDKSMEIGLYGNFDIDEIIKFFTGEGTIVFSNEDDKYYNFKILDQIDYEKLLKFKTAVVTFHCQPFKYPVEETPIEGEAITITGSGSNITLENTMVAPMNVQLKGNTYQETLPTGYTAVEYIQNDLYQQTKIRTGRHWNDTTKIETRFETIQASGNGNKLFVCTNYTESTATSPYAYVDTYNSIVAATPTQITINSRVVDNENVSFTYTSANGGEICISTWTDTTWGGTFKYKYFKIYNGNNLVRYFIPCVRDSDTAIGMFDLVGKNFYTNDASGTYAKGNNTNIPNPNNPQNINSVSGENNIIINGKNLQEQRVANATIGNVGVFSSTTGYDLGIAKINQGQEYVISGIEDTANYQIVLGFFYSKPTFGSVTYNNSRTILVQRVNTFTAPITGYVAYRVNSTDLYTMIEKGNVASAYEEYKSKIYSIDLSSKNLARFPENLPLPFGAGISTAVDFGEDKTFDKITLSFNLKNAICTNSSGAVVDFLKNDGTHQYRVGGYFGMQVNTLLNGIYSYTEENITFRKLNIYTYGYINFTQGTLINLMLNAGDIALPYEQYFDPISLYKIPNTNYQDNIFNAKDGNEIYDNLNDDIKQTLDYGSWYVEKKIGKVVLNGSENWQQWGTGTVFYIQKISSVRIGLSNYYKYNETATGSGQLNNGEFFIHDSANNNYVLFKNTSTTTLADFKTWLGTYNTEVLYVLDTPTYEKIESETLSNQLDLFIPYSYSPTTNITQTNNDAPFELDVSLSYTNTMNVNNVGNIYAKPILTIEGSGTIGIILNDIEVLSVDLGTDEKITIDVPNLQAYNPDDNVLLNRNVTGDYMKLLINDGDNTIAFSGSVTSATLTNYTRYI